MRISEWTYRTEVSHENKCTFHRCPSCVHILADEEPFPLAHMAMMPPKNSGLKADVSLSSVTEHFSHEDRDRSSWEAPACSSQVAQRMDDLLARKAFSPETSTTVLTHQPWGNWAVIVHAMPWTSALLLTPGCPPCPSFWLPLSVPSKLIEKYFKNLLKAQC